MTADRLAILAAYAGALLTRARLRSSADIEALQAARWARQARVLKRAPAYAAKAGRPISHFPVVDASAARADFAARNTLGLDLDTALAVAEAAETGAEASLPGGVTAGLSTGTSGARGVFLASPAERARYLGEALARLLPGPIWKPWRIALVLRADSALYRDVEQAGRFRFAFHGLDEHPSERAEGLQAFDPHVLIAPAHVLRTLEAARLPSLRRVLAGAEPMSGAEAIWLRDRLGVWPEPIYQATEGFLGSPCPLGGVHLNEDMLVFERQPVPGAPDAFQPIVTDLVRRSQPAVRLRLDDVLEELSSPCACGSPFTSVRVHGRVADVWRIGDRTLLPGQVEDALEEVLPFGADWAAVLDAEGVEIVCADFEGAGPAAAAALRTLAGRPLPIRLRETAPVQDGAKRRRVRNLAT
jgi:putative adenylate-forming enzyme